MKKLFTLLAILVLGFSLTGCKHKHELVQHEAKQATCTEDGHYAYEECTECDYTTYVKIEALGHKDEDFDHNCDNNCGETLGEHVDTNNDHNCDYGCEEAIGEHVDTNNDHKCEYGCEEAIGEHVDTNNDHNCDYGCSETIGEHEDTNNDHKCDYGCSETIGEHVDLDKDHYCDYNCNELLPCLDSNGDFICDICEKVLLTKETLQIKIDEFLLATDVSINQHILENDNTHYIYINSMFMHILMTEDSNTNNYIFNEDDTMYQMYKDSVEPCWIMATMEEARTLNVKSIFATNFSLVVHSDISLSVCTTSTFEDCQFLKFTDFDGDNFGVVFDNETIVGLLFFDSSNNITDVLSFSYGVIDSEIEVYNLIKEDYEIGYYYDISNQSYCVFNDAALKEVVELVDVEGEMVTIKLMNDIELSTVTLSDDSTAGLLISNGYIILDLNGYALSTSSSADCLIHVGAIWGGTSDATLVILDSSSEQQGLLVHNSVTINNFGSNLIINGGRVQSVCEDYTLAVNVQNYLGNVTINGGSFYAERLITSSYVTACVYQQGNSGTVTINGGVFNANGESAFAVLVSNDAYINGGTFYGGNKDISGGKDTVYLGVSSSGLGAMFPDGLSYWINITFVFADSSINFYNPDGEIINLSDTSSITTVVATSEYFPITE